MKRCPPIIVWVAELVTLGFEVSKLYIIISLNSENYWDIVEDLCLIRASQDGLKSARRHVGDC